MKFFLISIPIIMLLFLTCQARTLVDKDRCKNEQDTLLNRVVYTQVDTAPQFGTEKEELLSYFIMHLKMVDEDDFQSRINLILVIDTSGYVVIPIIKNKGLKNLSNAELETIKAAEHMPKWKVGKCNGKAVPVRINIPINL